MKKTKIMSAFLSLTLGMTSLANIPVAVNAESVDNEDPKSAYKYAEPVDCTKKVMINVCDYDTGKIIENVNVKVVKGYEGTEEVCSFNTTENPDFVYNFEYTTDNFFDDKGVYEIILENLPEYYNFTNNTTSWMLYLDEQKAGEYEDSIYKYNLDIHPVISDVQGTGTRPVTNVAYDLTTTGTTSDPNLRWDYYDFKGPHGDPNYRPTTTTTSTTTKNTNVTTTVDVNSPFKFEKQEYNLAAGDMYILKLNNPDSIHMDYVVEDKEIAEEKILYPTYVYVNAKTAGKTTVTAIGDNGETAEAVINVYQPDIVTTTSTTGTGIVTATVTETTYVRSTPNAGVTFDEEENNMFVKANDVKDFSFTAFGASDVRFSADTDDLKFEVNDYSGGGIGASHGTLSICAADGAEPRYVYFNSYAKHYLTGEEFKTSHGLLIAPEEFTPTTTLNPNATTTSSTTWSTRTTYGTVNNTSPAEKTDTTTKGSATNTTTSTTTIMSHITTGYPTTTVHIDYRTFVEYDHSPLRVGESRKIRFYHPATKKSEAPSIGCTGTNVSYTYNEGDDFITVKALKEGKAELGIREKDCAFSGSVNFDIVPADAEIITALYEGLTNIYQTEGQNTITTDMIAPYYICDKGSNLNLILFAEIEDAEGRKEIRQIQIADIDEVTIKSQAYEYYTNEDFKELNDGRYLLYLGSKDKNYITLGNSKYYLYRNFDDIRDPAGAVHLYINDKEAKHDYVRIEPTKVLSAVYTHGDTGLSFNGIDTKFRIDADSEMHIDWNMPSLHAGDTVNGVLYVNGDYVVTGDLDIIGKGSDANCDDEVNMADAVLIMQAIANPDKYGETGTDKNHITAQGTINADIADDGMTNADALAIQKRLLGLS